MSSDVIAISNNPLVWRKVPGCLRVQGNPLDVFYRCLSCLADSHVFYSHPLTGNERLSINPYRSVVMEKKQDERAANEQIRLLEGVLRKMEDLDFSRVSRSSWEDYRTVDYELFMQAYPADR